MASAQDRFNINHVALEKWTKREQLCLASAVSCSGDQNWMTVSRSLKVICGAHRPPDWFSQKKCAVKYGELLEKVETPKRKKRTTSDTSSSAVGTPTDSILRRLTEERIQELKSEIREQQETYAKLYTDIVNLQTGNSNEEQIRAMWMEIQRELEQDRQLEAREQIGTPEIQRNWRQGPFHQPKQQSPTPQIKQEQDMDIDATCKPQGTSPLLSSLLKSSSPVPLTGTTTTTTNTVRVNAPTITNLLTGGIISSSSASSSSTSSPSSSQTSGLLSQPIPLSTPLTGPGPSENILTAAPTVLSPSQSAPTLSMLLEKNKSPRDSPNQQQTGSVLLINENIKVEPVTEAAEHDVRAVKNENDLGLDDEATEDGRLTPTKEEEQQLMEAFKNLMPESIDELADILENNNGILNTGMLEEESILGGVETLIDDAHEVDYQLEVKMSEMSQDSKNPPPTEEESGAKIKTDQSSENDSEETKSSKQLDCNTDKVVKSVVEHFQLGSSSEQKPNLRVGDKVETISSDDSSDNVPLAAHTKDSKIPKVEPADEQTVAANVEYATVPKESVELQPHDDLGDQPEQANLAPTRSKEDDDAVLLENDDTERTSKVDQTTADARKGSISDCSDVIIIPTDDESSDGKTDIATKKPNDNFECAVPASNEDEEHQPLPGLPQHQPEKTSWESPFLQEQTITSISLPDTDDDSSTFETPTATPKDDKLKSSLSKKHDADSRADDDTKHANVIRKLRDRNRSESPLVEDDASDHSMTVRSRRRYSSTPVMDSIPNSPASSEDREYKVWKKSLMTVYNNLLTNKNAAIFLRPFNEEQTPCYKQVCQRPIDLQIIKRHIENGTIRNIVDLQRDVFLMCQNAIMVFKRNSSYAIMARELMHEFVQLKDQVIEAKMDKSYSLSASYTPGMKIRGSARKSQRLP